MYSPHRHDLALARTAFRKRRRGRPAIRPEKRRRPQSAHSRAGGGGQRADPGAGVHVPATAGGAGDTLEQDVRDTIEVLEDAESKLLEIAVELAKFYFTGL